MLLDIQEKKTCICIGGGGYSRIGFPISHFTSQRSSPSYLFLFGTFSLLFAILYFHY